MKSPVVCLLGLLILTGPVSAEVRHHRRDHIVGTRARHDQAGYPITAAKDSIRINAVGEVISQPVSVIQKERNFDARARKTLSGPATQEPDAAAKP